MTGGVIELEEGVVLEEGTHVRIEVTTEEPEGDTNKPERERKRYSIFDLGKNLVELDITDGSVNADKYIYTGN
mgnify:FL=1